MVDLMAGTLEPRDAPASRWSAIPHARSIGVKKERPHGEKRCGKRSFGTEAAGWQRAVRGCGSGTDQLGARAEAAAGSGPRARRRHPRRDQCGAARGGDLAGSVRRADRHVRGHGRERRRRRGRRNGSGGGKGDLERRGRGRGTPAPPSTRISGAPTTRCACTCARWARSSCCRARARSRSPSGSRPAATPCSRRCARAR